MDENLIAGHQALDGFWRRGLRDAVSFLRDPRPSIGYTVFVIALALLAATRVDDDYRIVVPLITFIVLIAGLMLVLAVAICHASFAQRNEARKELLELRRRLQPKLNIGDVVVHHPSSPFQDPSADYQAVRMPVINDSDATAEKCEAKLLWFKPFVKWLPYKEGDRAMYTGGDDIQFLQELPCPIPLSWTLGAESSINIPPCGEALLNVCYYYHEGDSITLAFPSEEMRWQYRQFGTDVVFAIRVDSKGCLPVYCVGKYSPDPQIDDPSVLLYEGQDYPDLKDHQRVEVTPRPQDWDN